MSKSAYDTINDLYIEKTANQKVKNLMGSGAGLALGAGLGGTVGSALAVHNYQKKMPDDTKAALKRLSSGSGDEDDENKINEYDKAHSIKKSLGLGAGIGSATGAGIGLLAEHGYTAIKKARDKKWADKVQAFNKKFGPAR